MTQSNSLTSQSRELNTKWTLSWIETLHETVSTNVSSIFSNSNISALVESKCPGATILDIKRNTSGHGWSLGVTIIEMELPNWTKAEMELK